MGPRPSFVLWDTMIEALLGSVSADDLAQCHLIFAGASTMRARRRWLPQQGPRWLSGGPRSEPWSAPPTNQ